MAQTFCHQCNANVEDTGGYCLLGHRLSSIAPPPPPAPSSTDETPPATPALHAIHNPPPAPESVTHRSYSDVIDRAWSALEATAMPAADDPINTFAPPPRMDWGPNKGTSRFRLRRSGEHATV